MLHLDLESYNHRGDETHIDTEEVVGEVSLVQRPFMVQRTVHHRQNHVKTKSWNTSATTSEFQRVCQCDCACRCVHQHCERRGSSSHFLVVIFKPELRWLNGEVCLSGFVSCFRCSNRLVLSLLPALSVRKKHRERK